MPSRKRPDYLFIPVKIPSSLIRDVALLLCHVLPNKEYNKKLKFISRNSIIQIYKYVLMKDYSTDNLR